VSANPRRELLRLHTERELHIARVTLSAFVVEQAEKARGEVGFGWVPQPDAPSRYGALLDAFNRSSETGEPLPVSDEHSGSVIYADAEVNYALRFLHDVSHVQKRLTFELTDELELALWHLSTLEAEGFGPQTVVWQLLRADLMGSVYVIALARRFPEDQKRFAEGCLYDGFDASVLAELRRSKR